MLTGNYHVEISIQHCMSIYYVRNLAEQFFYFLIWYGIRTKQFALLLKNDLNESIAEDHRETILIMCIFFHLPKYNETVLIIQGPDYPV